MLIAHVMDTPQFCQLPALSQEPGKNIGMGMGTGMGTDEAGLATGGASGGDQTKNPARQGMRGLKILRRPGPAATPENRVPENQASTRGLRTWRPRYMPVFRSI